jgi:hypothetical protein
VRRFATTLTVAMAGVAAVASAAEAATFSIAPVKACYLSGEPITATGTGFTPGGAAEIAFDGDSLGQFAVDAAGGVLVKGPLGSMPGVKTHALTATDPANPVLTATASFLGTMNTVTFKPKRSTPGSRVRIKGYGFLDGPRVYMHVRGRGYRSDGRIAKPKAPCGTFTTRTPIVPAGASPGEYKIQFDSKGRYSKKTRPAVHATLTVFRTARSSAAR